MDELSGRDASIETMMMLSASCIGIGNEVRLSDSHSSLNKIIAPPSLGTYFR